MFIKDLQIYPGGEAQTCTKDNPRAKIMKCASHPGGGYTRNIESHRRAWENVQICKGIVTQSN